MLAASLLVVQGPNQGQRFALRRSPLGIGRSPANAVCLGDSDASPEHARLEADGDRWRLTDLGAAQGTFVNGRQVRTHMLEDGDHVQVGRTVLVFTAAVETPAEPSLELVDSLGADDQTQIISTLTREQAAGLRDAGPNWSAPDRTAAALQVLYRIGEEAARPRGRIEELLTRILELLLPAIGGDRACLLIADARTDRITPRVVVRRTAQRADERFPVSRSIVQYVIQTGAAVRTSDARHDIRFEAGESILHGGIREAICTPLQGRFELLGVLYVDTTTSAPDWQARGKAARFDDEQLALAAAVARQAALAVENARYQEALVQSERLAAVGQAIAVLSHHIKNILQGVRGGSYLIDLGLKQDQRELISKGWGIVERNQERIYRLVLDMLTFSKDRQPVMRPVRLQDLVGEIVETLRPQAEERGVTLTVQQSGEIPETCCDGEGLHHALLNLVVNALEALEGREEGGRIALETVFDAPAQRIGVDVTDNGPGLTPEQASRLFAFFESGKGARGTGLGLAVSRKILREHGGDLTYMPAPGGGCRFRMVWPHTPPDRSPPAESPPAREPSSGPDAPG